MKTQKDFTYYVHMNIQICNDDVMMINSYNWAYDFLIIIVTQKYFPNFTCGFIRMGFWEFFPLFVLHFKNMYLGTLLHHWWECKLIQPLWKTVWRFLKKLKIELPYDPAIPLLGIYPEKTIIQKDTCTPMFIAAQFTIARTWKQPKCPSTDEWIKKMWHMYTMEYYSARPWFFKASNLTLSQVKAIKINLCTSSPLCFSSSSSLPSERDSTGLKESCNLHRLEISYA